jgi:hypothetical protein
MLDFFRYDLVRRNLTNFSATSAHIRETENLQDNLQRHENLLKTLEIKTRQEVDEIQNYLFQQAGVAKVQVDRVTLSPGGENNTTVYEMRLSGDWSNTMNFLSAAFYGDKYLLNITDVIMEIDARGRLNTSFHYKIYFADKNIKTLK